MADFLTLGKVHGGGHVTLNKATIASVRPRVTGHGSFIVTTNGVAHTVHETFEYVTERLS